MSKKMCMKVLTLFNIFDVGIYVWIGVPYQRA